MSFATLARRLKREHGQASASDLVVTIAADFLRGGDPTFARTFDRRGVLLGAIQRLQDEPWATFKTRAVVEAGRATGASSVLIGGLPDADSDAGDTKPGARDDLPRGAIVLPDIPPHPSQLEALGLIRGHRRVALVCGRRWGKTSMLVMLAVDAVIAGRSVGVFCPTYKFLGPLFEPIVSALRACPVCGSTACSAKYAFSVAAPLISGRSITRRAPAEAGGVIWR